MNARIDRRRFLSLLGAAIAAPALPKRIYCFAPPNGWTLAESGLYTYRYAYRNSLTGCVTDPIGTDAFAFPVFKREWLANGFLGNYDMIDIYSRIPGTSDYELRTSHKCVTTTPRIITNERLPS